MHRYGVNLEAASDWYHNGYVYIADVQPDGGGEPFRATFRERFSHTGEFHEPGIGEQVRVKFDKDRQVEFDRSVLREMATASKTAEQDRFSATAGAAPGTPVASHAQSSPDDAAATYRAMRIRAAITQAEQAGNAAEVERLQGMLAKVEAGDLSLPDSTPIAPPADPLDRIQKLSDLHESGALTDEEFAAQKAKLLDAT